MVTERYLLINRRGNIRMTSRPPVALRNGEVMIRLRVNIDTAIFTTGIPLAEMTIDPESIATGIDVRIERQGRTQIIQYDDAVIRNNRQLDALLGPPVLNHLDNQEVFSQRGGRSLDEIINEGYTVTDMPTRRRHDPAQDE